ncbi:MAG: beta-fructosidase [Cyanobacteria bacterium J06643_4]
MTQKPSAVHPKWDPWVLYDAGCYRLFYLSGRTDQDPWWKTSWICGATSQDFVHWTHTGPLLEPSVNLAWASGRIFAGSTYKEDGLFYLFYSAASEIDIAEEAIGLATSTDGVRWQKEAQPLLSWRDAKNISTPGGVGYAGRCSLAGHLHWRDPYVVKCPNTEKYYLFFCTSLTSLSMYQGGLGIAVADTLAGPYQLLPPAAGPGVSQAADSYNTNSSDANSSDVNSLDASLKWPFYHLERPQVIFFQNRYHLFFSCFKSSIDPLWLAQVGEHRISDSTLYWYTSDEITGPFVQNSDLPVVMGSEMTGLYGTTFFPKSHDGDWSQAKNATHLDLTVLGWYHQDYRLAISQEFVGVWSEDGLSIVENK